MLNEIEEFKAYTTFPDYAIENKRDTGYLGRFTYTMFKKFTGFSRVLAILARGYMWENDEPDVDRAHRALCAWCSLPENIRPKNRKAGQDKTCFAELHGEFPELVDKDGAGWCYTHVHNIIDSVLDNIDRCTNAATDNVYLLMDGFNRVWCEKLMQMQASLYSKTTKGAWITRFDDVIAEAKESGRLKNKDFDLPAETEKKLVDALIDEKRADVIVTLAKFYLANKPEDSDWVVLPVENFNAYYGTTSFDRKWLPDFPEEIIVRDDYAGLCRYRMNFFCSNDDLGAKLC